jgi:hypothetical protein
MAAPIAKRLAAGGKAGTEAYNEAVRLIIANADRVWPP